jgi:hypothetical protein
MMEAVRFPQTLVHIYQTLRCNIPQDRPSSYWCVISKKRAVNNILVLFESILQFEKF